MRGKPELWQRKDGRGNLLSPYWYIRYYDGSRSQRISTGCLIGAQDHEAHLALASFILERERPIARQPGELLIAQALADYYNEHAKHIATSKHALYHEKRLKAYFGNRFVAHITPSLIADYVRSRQEAGESNGTIRRDLEHLQAALNHEVREQRLVHAPKFKLPPPPPPREKYLSGAEVKKLLAYCKAPHLKHFVIIMLNTGQRPAAVENLTWFQVDFKQRILHFDKTGKQQTNKRVRPVPMNNTLYRLLKKLHKVKKTEYVLEYKPGKGTEVRHAGCVKKAFARACQAAGLRDVSRYTLRHTVVNQLDDLGVDDKTIMELVGHTNVRTTRAHYIKAKMEKLRGAVATMGKSAPEVHQGRKRKK